MSYLRGSSFFLNVHFGNNGITETNIQTLALEYTPTLFPPAGMDIFSYINKAPTYIDLFTN